MMKKQHFKISVLAFIAVFFISMFSESLLPLGRAYSAEEVSTFYVYFPLYLRSGVYLAPVRYLTPASDNLPQDAIEALIKGIPQPLIDSSGLRVVPLPKETKVLELLIEDGQCIVDFSGDIRGVSVGAGGESAVISSIVRTLNQFIGVNSVQIKIDGQAAESLAGHIDISRPLYPESLDASMFLTFPDAEPHWAGGAISALQVSDVVDGYPDGTFQPDKTLTRAEFVKMLVEAVDLPYSSDLGQTNLPFEDLTSSSNGLGHWSVSYVERAVAQGIISAEDYGDTFKPDEPISREEASYLLLKGSDVYLADNPEILIPSIDRVEFTDGAKIHARYAKAVEECVRRGFFEGYPDGTFKPNNTLTRGEACTILARMQGIQGEMTMLIAPKPGFEWNGSEFFTLGFARAHEANVNWRVNTAKGDSFIAENYTTSSNGMGWGAFGLCIDEALLRTEEPLVFDVYLVSAKDGSEFSLISVPLD